MTLLAAIGEIVTKPPTGNSTLKTPNGSDSAFTSITDPLPLHRLRQVVGGQSCIGIAQHPQCEDRSDQAQEDEITRTSGEGVGLLDEQEAYLKNER